jgi:hypothetical protein
MKAIIFYIALLFLMTSDCLYGQQQGCIENDRFANACTRVVKSSDDCPTWTNDCGDGWVRSHGTPNIGTYQYEIKGQIRTGYFAYMWSTSNSEGEGMYTPYVFLRGHSYDVTLTVATTNDLGSIKIYAANGLVQGGLSGCGGNPLSLNVFKVPIGEYVGNTNGEITISFTFVNNSIMDLTQIWIYPEGDGGKYETFVKWVEVCPSCSGEIVYNRSVDVPRTTRLGTITAGSTAGSGNSGVVQVAGNTNFYATNVIRLLPEFDANAINGTFTAKVDQCYLLPARMETRTPISRLVRPFDDFQSIKTSIQENKINIYPSVTTGPVYIIASQQDLQNAEIIVFDQLGKKVLAVPKANYSGKAQINLGTLRNGIYILQIKQSTKTITQKVIVQK